MPLSITFMYGMKFCFCIVTLSISLFYSCCITVLINCHKYYVHSIVPYPDAPFTGTSIERATKKCHVYNYNVTH